jgi:hypothetical protein
MTLIAAQVVNGIPIILGDLLITVDRGDSHFNTISIPTVDNVNRYLEPHGSRRVVGISQKINLVARNVCVAWSGSKLQASMLIRHLYDQWNDKDVTEEMFVRTLDKYPRENSGEIKVIAYLYDKNNRRFCSKDNIGGVPYELGEIRQIQMEGSGMGDYLQVIEQISSGKMVGEATSLDEVVARVLNLISTGLGAQIMEGVGLVDGWGGGFELAFIVGDSFEKLSDILFLFWKASINESGNQELIQFPRLIKQAYQNNRLLLHVADWKDGEVKLTTYKADPLFGSNNAAPQPPDFGYRLLVNVIQSMDSDGTASYYSRCNQFGSGDIPIRVEITNGKIKLDFRGSFMEELFEGV